MRHSLRSKRFQVALRMHGAVAGPILLGIGVASAFGADAPAPAMWLLGLLALYFLTFRRLGLTAMLERAVLLREACPTCSLAIDLTNWWRCSCGYVGAYERHVLLACRNCRSEFSWLNCPRCETQIPL